MNLKKYDNKRVKIMDKSDDEFEGICTYNDKEYNFHEYGSNEESLEILNVIFYKSNIKSVNEIKDYTNNYSKLEEIISEDAEEILKDDEVDEEHKQRLINYLKANNLYK